MKDVKIIEGDFYILLGEVEHETRVTFIKGTGWGCRVYTNGRLSQGCIVDDRSKIGAALRMMLRMEDKCGNISEMASNSRMRPGRKEAKSRLTTSLVQV